MAEFKVSAQKRTVIGKQVGQLRRDGFIPATIYGPQTEAVNIQLKYRELELMLLKAGGTNVIHIDVDGAANYTVLAREVQRDIIKGTILHIDFFAPDMTKKIRAEIPISIEGQSPLVVSRKGILLTGSNSLTVEMLPSRLINVVRVDVSVLTEIGAAIAVKDLKLGDIVILNDPEEMVAKVVQPSAARAAEAAASAGDEE